MISMINHVNKLEIYGQTDATITYLSIACVIKIYLDLWGGLLDLDFPGLFVRLLKLKPIRRQNDIIYINARRIVNYCGRTFICTLLYHTVVSYLIFELGLDLI